MRIILLISLLLMAGGVLAIELDWSLKTYQYPSNKRIYSEARGTATVRKTSSIELYIDFFVTYDLLGATKMNNDIDHQSHIFFMNFTLMPHLKNRSSYGVLFTDIPGMIFAHDQNPFEPSHNLLYMLYQQIQGNDVQWTAGSPVSLPVVPIPVFPGQTGQMPVSVSFSTDGKKVVARIVFAGANGAQSVYELSLLQAIDGFYQLTLSHEQTLDTTGAVNVDYSDIAFEFTVTLSEQALHTLLNMNTAEHRVNDPRPQALQTEVVTRNNGDDSAGGAGGATAALFFHEQFFGNKTVLLARITAQTEGAKINSPALILYLSMAVVYVKNYW